MKFLPVVLHRKTYARLLRERAEAESTVEKQAERIAELGSALALTRLEMREHRKDRSTRP